jgi:hypothetical protein
VSLGLQVLRDIVHAAGRGYEGIFPDPDGLSWLSDAAISNPLPSLPGVVLVVCADGTIRPPMPVRNLLSAAATSSPPFDAMEPGSYVGYVAVQNFEECPAILERVRETFDRGGVRKSRGGAS